MTPQTAHRLCILAGRMQRDLTSLYADKLYGMISREEACKYYNLGNAERLKTEEKRNAPHPLR